MTLMKLAMDGEFRTAITKVMTELKQAGVDVTPEVSCSMDNVSFLKADQFSIFAERATTDGATG